MVGVKQHKWNLELVYKLLFGTLRRLRASSASSGVFGRLQASSGVFGVFGRLRRLRASSASSGVFGVFGRLRRLRASSASSGVFGVFGVCGPKLGHLYCHQWTQSTVTPLFKNPKNKQIVYILTWIFPLSLQDFRFLHFFCRAASMFCPRCTPRSVPGLFHS